MFNIIKTLISHNAQSVLLCSSGNHIFSIINANTSGEYSNEQIWQLILTITDLHRVGNTSSHTITNTKQNDLLSQAALKVQWTKSGLLPLTTATLNVDPSAVHSTVQDDAEIASLLCSL